MSNLELFAEALVPVFLDEETKVDEALVDDLIRSVGELATDDLVCVMSGGENFEATFRGLDGMREAWRDWLETFATVRLRVDEFEQVGENVLVLVRQIGVTRHGGVELEQPSAAVWKFRDGRIHRIEFHLDRHAAQRSAAL